MTHQNQCLETDDTETAESNPAAEPATVNRDPFTETGESKHVEAPWRESEERYRIASEIISDFIYALHIEPDGSLVREWAIGDLARITGMTLEELDARGGVMSMVHPDDRLSVLRRVHRLLSGQPDETEYRIVAGDGEIRWIRNFSRPVWDDAEARVVRIYGAAQDITERKQAEEARQTSEERFRLLAENTQDVVYRLRLSPAFTFEYLSPAFATLTGYTPEECYANPDLALDIVHPQDRHLLESLTDTVTPQVSPLVLRLVRRDGAVVWIEQHNVPVHDEMGDLVALEGIARDITDRVRLERQLRDSEERWRALVQHASDIVATVGADGTIRYVSPSVERILGYRPEDPISRNTSDYVPPESVAGLRAQFDALIQKPGVGSPIVLRVRAADGSWRHFEVITNNLLDTPSVGAVVVNARDITQRVRTQEELQAYRDRLEQLVEERTQELSRSNAQLAQEIAERAEAEQRLRLEGTRVQALSRVAAHLSAELELDAVLDIVCQEAIGALDVCVVSVTVYEVGGDVRQHAVASDALAPGFKDVADPGLWALCGGQARAADASTFVLDGDALLGLPGAEVYRGLNIGSVASASMVYRERQVGRLCVFAPSDRRGFSEGDLEVLGALAGQAAQAVANARMFEEMRDGRERLHALSQRLMQVQEFERRRIARELHDGIGQALTALKMHLQHAQRLLGGPEAAPQMGDGVLLAEQALQQVRELSFDLRPSLLDDLGLVSALRWYADRQAQLAGFSVDFAAAGLESRLPPDVEIACFRTAQEALTNVVRHAQARQVRIRLRRDERELHLGVVDDGVGFDVNSAFRRAAYGASLGLLAMQERAELAGGRVRIRSLMGLGTGVHARFPLEATPPAGEPGQEDTPWQDRPACC
jgi:PAS domain S-box-containing protein